MSDQCPHHETLVEQVSKLCDKVDEFVEISHKNEVRAAAQIAIIETEQKSQGKRQDSMAWTIRACGLCLLSVVGKVVYDVVTGG